ncbi:MAG: hypothetical protein ABIW19_17920 [Vicinamibacterales bacterium]
MSTKFCSNCGRPSGAAARYCESCGRAFKSAQPIASPPSSLDVEVAAIAPAQGAPADFGTRKDQDRGSLGAVDALPVRESAPSTRPGDGTPPTKLSTEFKNSLVGACSKCGYRGVMGWNKRRVTSGMATLMVASIPLTMIFSAFAFGVVPIGGFLIFVPAILLRLAFQRYYAQCSQCSTWLMLRKDDVTDIKKVSSVQVS